MSDSVFGQKVDQHIRTREALRAIGGAPSHRAGGKETDHVDALARRFIAAAPLAVLATKRADGGIDVTPRGDPPGFVRVLNDRLLAIPDRPGNRRMDAFENILATGEAGLIFVIPGHGDTLRVAGKAALVADAELCDSLAINGRAPQIAVMLQVERVMSHCPKAFVRGRIWQPEHWPDTSDVPTLAEMMVTHGKLAESVEEMDEIIVTDGQTRLY